jgi:hypothetical protein
MGLKEKAGALKAERSGTGYRTVTDQNDVVWRVQKDGEGKMIKVYDPHYAPNPDDLQPLPTISVRSREIDVLGAASVLVIALIVLMVGALIGAGLS